ncbi:hypothetical protein NO263_03945 [Gluconacetobacter entanii]|uniref:XRE family transcriptional regulator n=1 Tax=Gluconacetobacter entanii TaxID=108528 RepID=A0ABT3K2V6_9PROT|nr:hypothetical protein [Gluconacetobacter entanii]MCW4589729.1 hypothetical protein [Gluconacetobacter entanii]MCW4593432.1 hypothetical protein [Gluconacetobacter entanii]NPC89235.1 hypothetical protein [Gluconacetobacter entanii]
METNENSPAGQKKLDSARLLIRDALDQRRMSLVSLSRAIGKSDGYIHQYLTRGVPRYLPAEIREAVGVILGLDPADLADPEAHKQIPVFASITSGRISERPIAEGRPVPSSAGDIPAFRETDNLDQPPPTYAIKPGARVPASDLLAVWISTPRGRLRAGDIAYVDLTRSPRIGDTVVVVRDGNIETIGDLTDQTEGMAVVCPAPGNETTVDLAASKALKVRWIEVP